jgi:hypothetical protein
MQRVLLLAGALCAASPLLAQGTPPVQSPAPQAATAADSAILRALQLPTMMQRAREAGAPDSSLRAIVDLMRRRGIPPAEASEAIEIEVDAMNATGERDNFGAFVRAQVESGVRGQELAARIRAERARRGMGPGRAPRRGPPEGVGGRPEGAGPPAGVGRPEGAGPPAGRGRPEGAGPPAGAGRPEGSGRPGQAGPPAGRGKAPSADSARGKAPAQGRRP